MRTFGLIVFFAASVLGQTFYGTSDLEAFRAGRDKEFRTKTESPLLEADFDKFKGLDYFVTDTAFRVKAKFARVPDAKFFNMPTSTGITKRFTKVGTLTFGLKGKKLVLAVYQIEPQIREKFPEFADLLFVPFRDLTNGAETYGAGRYIDIKEPKGSDVLLDFNLAYNPNCAYGSTKYACPIPPKENSLRIAVRAGEKKFAYSSESETADKK